MPNYFPENMPVPGRTGGEITEFWDYCKQHELRFQQCRRCSSYRFHPTPTCWKCQSFDYDWVQSRGEGKVYSYIIVHHPPTPILRDKVPYNVVVVEMDDCGAVRVGSNVVDCPNEEIQIGMPVQLTWEDINSDVTLYRFRKKEA